MEKFAQPIITKGLGAVQWPFDIPFFLILNVAGGKGMAGPINEKHLPFTMQVDYVRGISVEIVFFVK